ncbi:hypothetical protein K3M67_02940 [Sphingobium sp. V4]|uniref:hypothetical protein n=1 Tax=Sphingobium sp. V4 TaxID=3038927 RepID=UPI002557C8AC|nr:hypothetical protein [Sphingobium sp. V4]WIW88952.1 hypothetical protein K3M67_02940 [Sphingobium sp. V4]
MINPAQQALTAYRNRVYSETLTLTGEEGVDDWTGYTARMEVRHYGAQPGSALISLATVMSGQGLVLTVGPNHVLTIAPRIEQATLAALPGGTSSDAVTGGDDAIFFHDLLLIAPDGDADALRQGAFNLKPGVTIA